MQKTFQKFKKNLIVNLLLINLFLVIFLGIALGLHLKIYPFNLVKDKILKPILKPVTVSPEMSKKLIIDKEVEKKINIFWREKEKNLSNLGQQVDYGGGIDWKKHIYWLSELQKGGYIILMRHGEREKWHESLAGFDAYELANKIDARKTNWYRAVCLTERGIESVKNTGRSFKVAKIKIQKVFSSPSCRARETAVYAFNRIDEIHSSLLHRTGLNPLDRYKFGLDLRNSLLNFNLDKDKNLFLSSHNSVIDFPDLIDEFNTTIGLEEGGFYIIEKKNNKLVTRYKFENGGVFNMLVYRSEPKKKKCKNPRNVSIDCSSM